MPKALEYAPIGTCAYFLVSAIDDAGSMDAMEIPAAALMILRLLIKVALSVISLLKIGDLSLINMALVL
ncbi:MAG: hypothetical protein DRQ62_02595 [Gammaproteobacteria bacterium]|nr:MAG: hypothetical protein DRQ62_02595 [Gammaproteobacteria bacterium]